MPRPTNKSALKKNILESYNILQNTIKSMSDETLNTKFDFSNSKNKTEKLWTRDKNPRDVLIHLHDWHVLLIEWIDSNTNGNKRDFLPAPYN